MPIQVAAHGFDLTDAIKQSCVTEVKDKLQPLVLHNLSARWILSLEREEHIAHLAWADGQFKGDITVRSHDMYDSIRQATKKAHDQMKKQHEKRYDSHKSSSRLTPVDCSVSQKIWGAA